MIHLRPEQMDALREIDVTQFVRRAQRYLRQHEAQHVGDLDDGALDERLRSDWRLARRYGLRSDADVMTFVQVGLALGRGFDEANELPWARELLNDPEVPSRAKASSLRRRAQAHLDALARPESAR